jgi:hypothetical protein
VKLLVEVADSQVPIVNAFCNTLGIKYSYTIDQPGQPATDPVSHRIDELEKDLRSLTGPRSGIAQMRDTCLLAANRAVDAACRAEQAAERAERRARKK